MKIFFIVPLSFCLAVCGNGDAIGIKSPSVSSECSETRAGPLEFKTLTDSMRDCKRLADVLGQDRKIMILDIGCAVGDFMNSFSMENEKTLKRLRYTAIGVDPLLQIYRKVSSRLGKQLYNKLYEVAIAEKSGMVMLNVNKKFPDLSSVKTIDLNALNLEFPVYSSLKAQYYDNQTFSMSCQSMTLDELCAQNHIDQIDLLKLDTQGNEYEILKSVSEELLRKTGIIYVETSIPEKQCLYRDQKPFELIHQFLTKRNFSLFGSYGLDDTITIEHSVDMNCIFINKDLFSHF